MPGGVSSFVDSCDETRPKSYCLCTIHSVQESFFEYVSFFDDDGFCKNLFFLFQWFRLSPLESLLGARIATSFSLCNHFKLRIQCCNLSQFWLTNFLHAQKRKSRHWILKLLHHVHVNLFVSCLNGASFATSCSWSMHDFVMVLDFPRTLFFSCSNGLRLSPLQTFHNSREDRHCSFSVGSLLSVLFHDYL